MNRPIPIALHGASGRMGQAIVASLRTRDDVALVAALGRTDRVDGSPVIDGVTLAPVLSSDVAPAVLVDFSAAAAFDRVLELALQRRIGLVSGTTGLDAAQQAALERAAASIPVLWSANFSLGIAVLDSLVASAARSLAAWDCEILETHHALKQDAPSGTALALGRTVAAARGTDFDTATAALRTASRGAPTRGEIGFAVTRAGDIVGEHTVLFAAMGERLELTHRATDRGIFARGAVAAACWIAGRAPGRYSLQDVIGATSLRA